MDGMGITKPPGKSPDIAEGARHRGRLGTSEAEPNLDGAFASDGVDLTLIRWMLRRTPTERLQAAQKMIDATWALRTRSET